MTPHWIYETDEAGNCHRCHFDGTNWHVLVECPDGNSAASSAPFRTDAVTKARLKLRLPVMAVTRFGAPPIYDCTAEFKPAQTILPASAKWSAHGSKFRGEPVRDPVAIVNEAIHERNAALRRFGDRVLPPWEWILASAAVAFAVVAWVYA